MAKQLILIVLFSLGAIVFKTEIAHMLDGLVFMHNSIAQALHFIFSDDRVGQLIQDVISLLFIPFVVGIVVATAFLLIKRVAMPHIMGIIWIMWLILLITMVAQTGIGPSPQTAVYQNNQSSRAVS